jgi:predicted nucleic acid-binding protein
MYLLDTNVVSEMRKAKPHGGVAAWVAEQSDDALFLCAVTIGEIQTGVELTRRTNPDKAAEIEAWLDLVVGTFNVLPMDGAAFRRCAKLMHRRPDHHFEDAMIAAAALERGLTVATRNVRDFQPFGVALCNPFEFGRS